MTRKVESVDFDKWFVPLLCLNLFVWVLARCISDSNLDPYGDMLENFAWGQEFSWGTHKHPPLTGWITGLWFSVMPRYDTAYHLLSYLNVMLGLLGMYRVAIAMGFARIAAPSVLLLAMALPYSTLAVKFNANAILLSLWPWVVFGWLKSQQETSVKQFGWSIFFGVISALALLGKYYTGVLMVGLLLASFSSVAGRLWLKSYKPWLAGSVFCVLLVPHFLWLADNDYISIAYISEQTNSNGAYRELFKFALAPIFYWLIPWVFCSWISSAGAKSIGSRWVAFVKNLGAAWYCKGWGDTLFWLVMLPWLITLVFGAVGIVALSLPWAIPLGFGFPLLWLRNLWDIDSTLITHLNRKVQRGLSIWLLLVLIVSPIYAWQEGNSESKNYYLPRSEAAVAILDQWHVLVPDERLSWVGGHWAENALVAFYGDANVRIIPGMPDSAAANALGGVKWQGKAGLLLCPGKFAARPAATQCRNEVRAWLDGNNFPVRELKISVRKTGYRFSIDWDFEYVGFIYLPDRGERDNDD
jgi:4-amino-4-deoxy-L-arabinose transferase-like glycosyltransferase